MNRAFLVLFCFIILIGNVSHVGAAETGSQYDQTMAKARKLMDDGKLAEAYLAASGAMTLDDKRWEAYGLLGLVLNAQGSNTEAKAYLEKALARAPEAKKAALQSIENKINQQASVQPLPSSPSKDAQLSGDDRRKLDALQLILEDADKAKQASDRLRLLNEFLEKSADVAKANPSQTNLWILRAATALEANKAKEAREAGNMLVTLGVDASADPKTRKLLAMLERKGWLGNLPPDMSNWTSDQLVAAATSGDSKVQRRLGYLYLKGEKGFPQNDAEAIQWFRKAAEQGDAYAQNNLGWMYQIGRSGGKNEVEAVKWYRKAAEQGDADGQSNLGWMYTHGLGVEKSDIESIKWYRKAAEQGNPAAQNSLALMLRSGRGVEKNDIEAVKWLRKATDQGNASAQANLGWMYENGRGVEKNEADAIKWYRKAADQGNTYAQKALERLRPSGTDQTIATGNHTIVVPSAEEMKNGAKIVVR